MTLEIAAGRDPDRVREALAACGSFDDVRRAGILFHGTCEAITGQPKGGAYDQVFWTAPTPAVAQAYIPRSGVRTWIRQPRDEHERAEHIRPSRYSSHAMQWALARTGVSLDDLDIVWDGQRAWSWTIPPGWPTHGDYDDFIRGLGYEASSSGLYDVSERYGEAGAITIMPAAWRMPGQLIVVLAKDLDLRDAAWSEDAQGYANHNRLADFQAFGARGLDGFRMGDMLQSEHHGNVGHEAIGILPAGLAKISWMAIPAVRNDGEDPAIFSRPETPEFRALMSGLNPAYRAEAEPAIRQAQSFEDEPPPRSEWMLEP